MPAPKIAVECLECGKRFRIAATADPQCPKCGGVDLDLAKERGTNE